MAAAFKDEVSAASVAALARVAAGAVPGFDVAAFTRAACSGLEALELKARIAQVADALAAALPGPFAEDAPRLARALGESELTMWEAWPAMTWIETCGLDDPEVALDAIAAFTARASGESAVRPYIDRHPNLAWKRLRDWAASDDEHLRRLASEGSRPRLPWARQVRALRDDPEPGLVLIGSLREDASEYVRRSVANHLNDVARDHPEAALRAAAAWRSEGGPHVDAVLRRGLRGLVKAGHPLALALTGVTVDSPVDVTGLEVPDRVAIGSPLRFAVTITSRGDAPARVAVDFGIAYVGARGAAKATKVFKGAVRDLAPGESWRFARAHPMRNVSIRTLYPGTHRVSVQVNGRERASAAFELLEA